MFRGQNIANHVSLSPVAVTIDASKDGVKFGCTGDIGNGAVTLRSHQNVEKPELNIEIELTEPVSLTFSLKYLVNFCKASALSSQVKICLSNEVPLLVEYSIQGTSWLRFYLAPKVRFTLRQTGRIVSDCIANICMHRSATRSKRLAMRRDTLIRDVHDKVALLIPTVKPRHDLRNTAHLSRGARKTCGEANVRLGLDRRILHHYIEH